MVITLVIFSMDRAMQLDSLLRSIRDNVRGVGHVAVIYRASSALQKRAYDKLREYHPNVGFVAQDLLTPPVGCSEALAAIVTGPGRDYVGLAVDDMIFYRPSDYARAAETLEEHLGFVWSWRLSIPARPDVRCACVEGCLRHWLVSALDDDRDYRYLFHTDGSLYHCSTLVNRLDHNLPGWRTGHYIPNDLEAAVMSAYPKWRFGAGPHLGPIEQTCITWQLNKEETTKGKYGAPWVTVPETELDAMAEAFLAGKRVNNEALYEDLSWTTRFNPAGARPTHVHACEEASRFYASLIR